MKKIYRIAAALLSVSTVFSLSACGGKPADSAVSSTPASSGTAAPSSAASTPASAEKDYSEKMTISWATVQVKEGTDYNGDDFTKQWMEKYNVEWEVLPLTWDNWAEKLRIWINSGDMPDVATWNYMHGEMATYAEQDLVRKFPDDWKEKWPNAAKAYADTVIGPQLDELFGGTYCLPKPTFSRNKPLETLVPHMSVHMRKDWLVAAGCEVKDYYTVDELLEICRKIKAADPGNVGSKLVPLEVRTGNMIWPFVFATSTYSQSGGDFYKGEDGTYKWGPADPDTLEGLKLYKQAYTEGLLHPEFYTLKQNQDLEDFYVAGTAAMTVEMSLATAQNRYANYLKENLGLNPDEAYHIAFVTDNDGVYHAPETINFWTANIFSPNMEDDKFDRIMDIIDYSTTEDGQYNIRMGIEGVDWEKDANGALVTKLTDGTTAADKYPSITPLYMNMMILSDDFGLIDPSIPAVYRDNTKRLYEEKFALTNEKSLGRTDWDAYFQDSPSRRKVAFDYPTEYAQIILKDGDVEANWNTWVNEKMQLVQPVLDELNALGQ